MHHGGSARWRRLAMAAACAGMSACGGGGGGGGSGDDSSDGTPFTATAQAISVDGGEPAADLTTTDTALAAALAAIQAARAIDDLNISQFDEYNLSPGHLSSNCDAGTLTRDIAEGTDGRSYKVAAAQCYNQDSDLLFDGTITELTTQTSNPIEGTLSAGSSTAPSLIVKRQRGVGSSTEVFTAGGTLDFVNDAAQPFQTTSSGVKILKGTQAMLETDVAFAATKWFETLLGGGSAPFVLNTTMIGTTAQVNMSGSLSYRSTGLATACSTPASFEVATTSSTLTISDTGVPSDGTLQITTPEGGSATVDFLPSGEANVVLASGTPVNYSVSQVTGFCGF